MTNRAIGKDGEGSGCSVGADLPGSPENSAAPRTDAVVFGVAGVLTLAFVLLGATATDTLKSVSGTLLTD